MADFACEKCEHKDGVLVHLLYLREGQDQMNAHLKQLNGRTRKVERLTAVHSWAISLIGAVSLTALGVVLARILA
jgi:hypothetical protein